MTWWRNEEGKERKRDESGLQRREEGGGDVLVFRARLSPPS